MMIENGFSSPRRNEVLPLGLRVLVVDDDLAWLKILEKMLKKCSYEVTTCTLAQEALQLLRDRKGGFDIVISDVNMPDMDGFKLLEHVGLEMDLPVIMMSVDGETSKVMKGVQHGACDYLLKPIRMKELKNIWQHVVRKRMHEGREIDGYEDKIRSDSSYSGYYSGDQSLLRKRKDVENKHDEKDSVDSYSMKKARVVWTVELHQKFVKAVNHIGIDSDKIGPKKILDLMNVPWLTRENVASHLQKYRLYLSRIRKEDETDDKIESFCGAMKNLDHPPKDNGGTFHVTNSTSRQQNDISTTQVYPENPLPANSVGAMTPFDTDLKGSNLLPLIDETKPFNDDKTRVSEVGVDCTFTPFDSPISGCYPWNTDISSMPFETEYKPHFSLEDCFIQPTPPLVQQPILAPLRISENEDLIESKYMNVEREVNNIGQQFPIEKELESMLGTNDEAFSCAYEEASLGMKNHKSNNSIQSSMSAINTQNMSESLIDRSFPLLSTSPLLSQQGLDPEIDMTKNQSSNLSNNISQGLRNEIDFGLLGEDFAFWWLQGGFDHIGLSDFNIPGHVNDVPFLKFGPDYDAFDCKECHVDHGLLF